jgi:CheY-like chemotaxis protein
MAAFLVRSGYAVTPAASAPAALAAVESGAARPELVLLDLFLPQINGLMLLASLRQIAGLETVPVIVLSTLGFPEIVEQAIAAGAQDFLLKPFDPELLAEKVSRILSFRPNLGKL